MAHQHPNNHPVPPQAHAQVHAQGAPARPPDAPRLAGEARLLVFVHHSVPDAPMQEPYGDNRRLAALGRRWLKAAYVAAVAEKRRDLAGGALQGYVDNTFAGFVDRWVTVYGWRQQLYGTPAGADLNAPQETLLIFETYAGAVVAQKDLGHQALMEWIASLV
ncbi:hypothetical protein L226DRAFT_575042 [Lentinus tigrinus ALCF2SS1-7]|uniref:Uncharacterized protein n=1 Tax=Lentinus tigrinus ALCF2SS1-6 TaxID=1328759 RepID=A0A5C2RU54_9APHY|nr:hypothetical protein L227DRAFT_615521 [Lentinus tigrinus ALCF2SS1-6]RPD70138.1 hypothetical protein L226DRAFT_575042 [Lentinus tigrinus ALCF2SS1-7]